MSNAVVLFDRVDKESNDFKKFQSIKKYLKDNKIYYKDLIQVNSLFDYASSQDEYIKLEVYSAINSIGRANVILTDASLNARSLFYTGVALAVYNRCSRVNVLLFKSEKTDNELFEKLKNISINFETLFSVDSYNYASDDKFAELYKGYFTAMQFLDPKPIEK